MTSRSLDKWWSTELPFRSKLGDLYLWLRPAIEIVRQDEVLALLSEEGEVLEFEGRADEIFDFLVTLDGTKTEATLRQSSLADSVLSPLRKRGWLVTLERPINDLLGKSPNSSREVAAFAQLFPERLDRSFDQLRQKSVLIIGCGGIGTNLAFALCALGIGRLQIVDPDTVEPTNLNRQFLFGMSDVGNSKVAVIERELSARFPNSEITALQADFDERSLAERLIAESDFVALCGESQILYDFPDLIDGTPLLMAGYRGATGTVGPLVSSLDGGLTWKELMASHLRAHRRNVSKYVVPRENAWNPSGFGVNSLTGSVASRICSEYLSGQPSSSRWLGMQLQISMKDLAIEHVQVWPSSTEGGLD